MIKYSAKSHACYDTSLNYSELPSDLVEITQEEHQVFMGASLPDGKQLKINCYPFKFEDIPDPTPDQLANIAQTEMIIELNWCDLQVKLHQSSDSRAVATLDDIFSYARSCRDYVRNLEGLLTISGDKPSRPK